MSAAFLVLSAFLASAVEMVEALTIVLAAGVARGVRARVVRRCRRGETRAVRPRGKDIPLVFPAPVPRPAP